MCTESQDVDWLVRRIGVPENRQNTRNPPPLSSVLFVYASECEQVAVMWRRIGVLDMAMDLDESRGKSREYLPVGSSPALSLVGDSTRGSFADSHKL